VTYASSYTGGDADSRAAEAEKLLEMISGHEAELAPKEQKFVADMRERFRRGPPVAVTGKQVLWLRDIKDRTL
jgi:hypothetical protein